MKVLKIERQILDFISSHWRIVFAIVAFICGILLRYVCLRFESLDYQYCLFPWSNELRDKGGFAGLADMPGNYNAPYMTIMAFLTYFPIRILYTLKAVSIFFDLVLAVAAALIAFEITKKNKKEKAVITFLAVWLSPIVILNGAAWCQCDAIYGSFCLLSVYCLLKKKDLLSFVFLGAAFAFKLQAIFILPIFAIIWFKKHRFSLLNFLVVPIVDFVLCIPALLFGMPASRMIDVYVGQVGQNGAFLTMNYPNVWGLFTAGANNDFITRFGIIFTFVLLLAIAAFLFIKKAKFNKVNVVRVVLVCAFTMLMFLPRMHERYGFAAEILALAYFIAKDRDKILLAYITVLPILTYSRYLYGTNSMFVIECAFAVVGYLIISHRLLLSTVEDKKRELVN